MLEEFMSFEIKITGKIFKVSSCICTFDGHWGPSPWGCRSASFQSGSLKAFSLVLCKAPRYFLTFPELIHYLTFSCINGNLGSQGDLGSKLALLPPFCEHMDTLKLLFCHVNRDDNHASITGKLNEITLIH